MPATPLHDPTAMPLPGARTEVRCIESQPERSQPIFHQVFS